jgi:hypothetical protein
MNLFLAFRLLLENKKLRYKNNNAVNKNYGTLPGIDELTGEREEDEGNLLRGVARHEIRQRAT